MTNKSRAAELLAQIREWNAEDWDYYDKYSVLSYKEDDTFYKRAEIIDELAKIILSEQSSSRPHSNQPNSMIDQESELQQKNEQEIARLFSELYRALVASDRIEAEEARGFVAQAEAAWNKDDASEDK